MLNELELFKLFANAGIAGAVIGWLTLFFIPRQERRQDKRDEQAALRADMREATFLNAMKDEESRHALAENRAQDFFERMLNKIPGCVMNGAGDRDHTGNTNPGDVG